MVTKMVTVSKNEGPITSDRPLLTALESVARRGGLVLASGVENTHVIDLAQPTETRETRKSGNPASLGTGFGQWNRTFRGLSAALLRTFLSLSGVEGPKADQL